VFSLILVGQLLSFSFVLLNRGIMQFDWLYFGGVSFLVQWIILASAALLCPLRPWFKRQDGMVAGAISYLIVLSVTTIFSMIGSWVLLDVSAEIDLFLVLNNVLIAAVYAGVVLRYFYLRQQLQNNEQAKLKARVQALQSRIRPHFLFNSMNSIASLIEIDPVAAEKMVVDLSQLFRASLSEVSLVPLSDELDLCRKFADIEAIRLGERLQINWDVELDCTELYIPSLLLQPLVENAIYHGIQPLLEGGEVGMLVREDATALEVIICNPIQSVEAKLQAERLQQNNGIVKNDDASLARSKRKANNGMALENIRHRLAAHYDGKGSLTLKHEACMFTAVVRIEKSLMTREVTKDV